MGASYLSRPKKVKESEDQQNKKLAYGVSSMQGWRLKQEDAHNCILDFDEGTALFGVYDGHGGAEVAIYTSEKLPGFIKDNQEYKNGDCEKALISAFLEFDDTLTSKTALTRLNEIIQTDKDDESDEENEESGSGTILFAERPQCSHASEDGDDDDDDADYEYGEGDPETETPDSLRRDASRPLEEVMASYIPHVNKLIAGERGIKPASPYLRGRRDGAGGSGECSSSYTGECSTSFVEPGPSSSNECSSSSSHSRTDKTEVNGSGDAEAETSVNGEPEPTSSKDVSNKPSEESSSNSKDESSTNGTTESLVNGSANVNGDINEVEASSKESAAKKSTSNCDEKPSCSSPSKKKKLALTDLDDSDVVKNFITNEEIDENDEDDSEDETFEVEEGAESDSDEDDSSYPESLLTKLKRRLCQVAMQAEAIDDDEDDDDDDDDDENDKDHTRSSELDEEAEEEGEEEEGEGEEDFEDDDSDDESIDLFGDSSNNPGVESGCTAVVALIKNETLYVANAGDSRCVICKDGKAVDMSEDHKPEDHLEKSRIEKAGGNVTSDGRVNGGLNLSRAIGDHDYKRNTKLSNQEQMIIALPDVRSCKLEPDVEFIVLACDGIWNSMTSQDVVNFIRPKIQSNQKLSTICEELFDTCLAPNTLGDGTGCDNMTCIIVKIRRDDDEVTAELDSKKTAISGDVEADSKEADICKNVEVDSTPAEVLKSADSSQKEKDDKKGEAVPSQESSEAQPVSETEEQSGSSTRLKRSIDSTEEDECQAKRQKTDTNVDSS